MLFIMILYYVYLVFITFVVLGDGAQPQIDVIEAFFYVYFTLGVTELIRLVGWLVFLDLTAL